LIAFQADADLDHDIVVAVRRLEPTVDLASAAEGGLIGLADPEVLEAAARQGRILVTHDRRTMPGHFRDRLDEGRSSPGVFIVSQFEPIGPVVEVLTLVWAASESAEWQNQVRHLPSLSLHAFTR
jgi:hypothetical protein